jgi:hypothetical protein
MSAKSAAVRSEGGGAQGRCVATIVAIVQLEPLRLIADGPFFEG